MEKLFDAEFLEKIARLVLANKTILTDGLSGNRKSRSKGSSVEFSDFREYSIGDDFRRIDWNAYARFEKLFVKLFMEEKEASVNIFIDCSKSMKWGEPDKSFSSRRLIAALTYISLSNYDKVSLIAINNKIHKYKLNLRGKNSFKDALKFLEEVEYSGESDLLSALKSSGLKIDRGVSIVVSDFLISGDLASLISYLKYKNQDTYICQVLSPQEISPSLDSNVRLLDVETNEYMDLIVNSQLMKVYKRIFEKFVFEIENTCKNCGVEYISISSSDSIDKVLKNVLKN